MEMMIFYGLLSLIMKIIGLSILLMLENKIEMKVLMITELDLSNIIKLEMETNLNYVQMDVNLLLILALI